MKSEALYKERAETIRQRMQAIRKDLPGGLEQTREEVNNLTDWKYYVRRYPEFVLPAVAIAAYSLVPQSRPASNGKIAILDGEKGVQRVRLVEDGVPKKSIIAGLASTVLALAFRHGSALAARQLMQMVQAPKNSSYSGKDLA